MSRSLTLPGAAVLAAALVGLGAPGALAQVKPTYVHAGRLVDPEGGKVLTNRSIRIEGSRDSPSRPGACPRTRAGSTCPA